MWRELPLCLSFHGVAPAGLTNGLTIVQCDWQGNRLQGVYEPTGRAETASQFDTQTNPTGAVQYIV